MLGTATYSKGRAVLSIAKAKLSRVQHRNGMATHRNALFGKGDARPLAAQHSKAEHQ